MSARLFTGACLCGAVAYEARGEATRFLYCHCSRCRRATGTGHASNLFVAAEAFRWLRGEEQLGRYDVPGAKRFHTQFCRVCGSPMPRIAADGSMVVIPAGSLNDDPGVTPTARIFGESRAPWSCAGDGLPVHPGYPPPVD